MEVIYTHTDYMNTVIYFCSILAKKSTPSSFSPLFFISLFYPLPNFFPVFPPSPLSLPPLFSSSPFKLFGPAASFVAVLLAVKSAFNGNTMAACRADPLYSNVTACHYHCISSSK